VPKIQVILDIECFPNYFLCSLKRLDTGAILEFEMRDDSKLDCENLKRILTSDKYEFVTFNGNGYDLPMLSYALNDVSPKSLKRASDAIIVDNLRAWDFPKRFNCVELKIDHIDLMEVAKGDCSLKLYAGRLHAKKMQDLPYDPDVSLTNEQMDEVKRYCRNDLENTELLLKAHVKQIDERRLMSKQYGADLRSKSDAQIAEAVIKSEVEKLTGQRIKKGRLDYKEFYYQKPDYVVFASEQLNNALQILKDNPFTINDKGVTVMPTALAELQIVIGETTYQMGMGGLHSTEKERALFSNEINGLLVDADVGSMYPSLMLNNGLTPPFVGDEFMTVFRGIRDKRVAAKRAGDKTVADLLKIVLNGTYGKLGSQYSIFYAPKMMVQVTLTGQLSILMLVHRLESLGISVVSANTDGIVSLVKPHQTEAYYDTMKRWEKRTGLEMEFTEYAALYNRDVNSYIALKPDGKFKTKGFFNYAGIDKNPQNEICLDALLAYLKDGVPFEQTVHNCTDIRKFVSVIRVTGGAQKDGEYLGKVVRFYYAMGVSGTIRRVQNGNTVPRSTGAKPLMELPDAFPTDINYSWYLRECEELLYDVGVKPRPVPVKLPRKNSKEWKQMFADGLVVEHEGAFVHVSDVR